MCVKVVLYSTNCPNCKMLEMRLKKKNISYEKNGDIELMKEKGFLAAPMLEVDETAMTFKEAIKWIEEYGI